MSCMRTEKHAEELKLKTEAGTEFTVYTYKPVQAEPRVCSFAAVPRLLTHHCALFIV